MPELPEVELVARSLREVITGRTVTAVSVHRAALLKAPSRAKFAQHLVGARGEGCDRTGKVLMLRFDRPWVLLVHLRMSGRFVLTSAKAPRPAHTHAEFALDDGTRLAFSDPRHFAIMKLVAAGALASEPLVSTLGPDPLAEGFTPAALADRLAGTRRGVKDVLLDQTRVAGLGNIYAAEALFEAKVSPFAPAGSLSKARVARLHAAIQSVLRDSLARGSTLTTDARSTEESYFTGGFHDRFRVYDREGSACPRCGAAVRRRTQAGRSTYYCPRCQAR